MTLPDILVILVLLVFALAGIRRGLVWELSTTIGLILGFGLTYYFRRDIMDLVFRLTDPGWQRQWGGGLLFLTFFLIIYLGFSAIGHALHEIISKTPLKWVDHILGLAAGLIKGAVLIGLLVAATSWLEGGSRLKNFLYDSRLIQWGKQQTYDWIHSETPAQKKWV
jgi:uncharacterized membrane protein required for colicin V production